MEGNYSVQIEKFAERHYIKSFQKKYKSHWDITLLAITAELERIDALLRTNKAEVISSTNEVQIVKTQFKIAKSKDSAKASGNRCIVAYYPEDRLVKILLVYGKTDLGDGNETHQWKNIVREQYPDFTGIL